MKPIAQLLFALLFSFNCFAQIKGRVVGVHDGDTFTLLTSENVQVKVRVHGVDCPELKQDFGRVAKQFASDLIFGKEVLVKETAKDKYGRVVGIATMPNGKILNEELLRYGYAWHYTKYDKNPDWKKLEEEARLKKVGLWRQPNAMPPWDYRKLKKKRVCK